MYMLWGGTPSYPRLASALRTSLGAPGAHLHNQEEGEGPKDGELRVVPFEP